MKNGLCRHNREGRKAWRINAASHCVHKSVREKEAKRKALWELVGVLAADIQLFACKVSDIYLYGCVLRFFFF